MATKLGCVGCSSDSDGAPEITMAFQPIVNVSERNVFAYEALVRGKDGRSAGEILEAGRDNLYSLDQACRVAAIEWASKLEIPTLLSVNFMPNAVYNPVNCLRTTLAVAERVGWPLNRLIFEVTEQEKIMDQEHVLEILKAYRKKGLMTAIDDFGAGFAGLSLLAEFQPDILKLDIELIRGIHKSPARQAIVRHTSALCAELKIAVIAEGVETTDEYLALTDMGVLLQQGYLFARPLTEGLPTVDYPFITSAALAQTDAESPTVN